MAEPVRSRWPLCRASLPAAQPHSAGATQGHWRGRPDSARGNAVRSEQGILMLELPDPPRGFDQDCVQGLVPRLLCAPCNQMRKAEFSHSVFSPCVATKAAEELLAGLNRVCSPGAKS